MRIVIDLDGTICELKKHGQTYQEVRPLPGAIEKLQALKQAGHYLIINSARHMKTCAGDVEEVKRRVGTTTEEWLRKHGIPYDELIFGKPYAQVYIDDLAHQFQGWDRIDPAQFDEMYVNILIPMAGRGSRFKNVGVTTPKPLIEVEGMTMIERALKSFDFLKDIPHYRLIFILNQEDEDAYTLSSELRRLFPDIPMEIRFVPQVTRGQAETCLAVRDLIDNNNRLFIHACDTYGRSNIWDIVIKEDPDGILACFESNDPRFSYAKLDELGYVTETAEKRVISNRATTGMYYFKRGADFVAAADTMITTDQKENGEFYVAPCYNRLVQTGKRVRVATATEYAVFGTPEELAQYLSNAHAQTANRDS